MMFMLNLGILQEISLLLGKQNYITDRYGEFSYVNNVVSTLLTEERGSFHNNISNPSVWYGDSITEILSGAR